MIVVATCILLVLEVVVAIPQQCYSCLEEDCETMSLWTNQTCATSRLSLGTSHCGTAAIRYTEGYLGISRDTTVKGCFDCMDERTACFALGGLLKSSRGWVVQQCEIDCCNTTSCNSNPTLLTQNATIVLQKDVFGTTNCFECEENDNYTCILNQQSQTCRSGGRSLGITHCSAAKVTTWNVLTGVVDVSFVRGCIDCEDKKTACALLAGSLKYLHHSTLLECDIECCNGSYCNDGAANLTKCWHCMEDEGTSCSLRQQRQICSLDPNSLGTTHCGSAVGRKRNQNGIIQSYFYRGCFDCAKKKDVCFTLGGFWKGDVANAGVTTLLECDVDCCDTHVENGSYCNVHTPKLKPAAVTVFTPTVTGPAQCNVCLERNAASCSDNQQVQICGIDPYSLGTTHCGTAVGTYRDSKGDIVHGFFRGCINCADKRAACAAVGGFRKNVQKWTQLECEIVCCTGDNCNTHIPDLVKQSNAAASLDIHYVLQCSFLAFYIFFVGIF
ncbi:uncharacterized skeletal organic matrix protein 2-like [Montipora capricornis]|uniref:uncharacterized skeletal organic matrix protein 2-like n=1 Tax=Montipora capricornis TaxID=246305 RepID=UPI0035F193B3